MRSSFLVAILSLATFFVLPYDRVESKNPDRKTMVKGVMVLRGHMPHVTRSYAERLVKEVIEVTRQPGNTWMKPHILLGLALNESDLRWWLVTGSYYGKDCGICQNHTPLFAHTPKQKYNLCKRLTKSTKLSFQYAMKELNTIRQKWCSRYFPKPVKKSTETSSRFKKRLKRWENDRYRCLLNLYNQGPIYLMKPCHRRYDKRRYTPEQYKHKVNMCRWRSLYWVRSLCFSKGLELGTKPKQTCRKAYSIYWINYVYGLR